jgi:hypothetical protein
LGSGSNTSFQGEFTVLSSHSSTLDTLSSMLDCPSGERGYILSEIRVGAGRRILSEGRIAWRLLID